MSAGERQRRGAFYTPRWLAETITAMAFADRVPEMVLDPACGGGAFLLAALDRFVDLGVEPAAALGRVCGIDIDPGAVEASTTAVRAWAVVHGLDGSVAPSIKSGDALAEWPAAWPTPDLVLGNPPFATPLKGAAHGPVAERFRRDRSEQLGPYADLAAIHLARAIEGVRPGGAVAFVLPQSLLSSRDVAGLRAHLSGAAPHTDVWASRELEFDANVRAFAPVLRRGGPRSDSSWAQAVAGALGVPPSPLVEHPDRGTLADLAHATAGFRDEYYALAGACMEDGNRTSRLPRLATVGSIDPLHFRWGEVDVRFAKQRWTHPVVDRDRVAVDKQSWFDAQLQPKILLPTQSRVLEPYVDRTGSVVPVTPLITVRSRTDAQALDRIAAVLLAPPVAAWAHRRWFGAALSPDAIKLASKNVLEIPLPTNHDAWLEAATLVPEGPSALPAIGALMTTAYGADETLFAYWLDRLPG